MPSSPFVPSVPEWLTASHSKAHQRLVYSILSKRERDRGMARMASLADIRSSYALQQALKPLLEKNEHSKHYSVAIGGHPVNQWGNRYSNIEPYDRTRVVVGAPEGDCSVGCGRAAGQGRYLNASWVEELYGGKLWIATQAPLPVTAHAFLSVIAQPIAGYPSGSSLPEGSRVRTVVQLTLNQESGRTKAHSYFPCTVNQTTEVKPEPECKATAFKVTLLEKTSFEDALCIQSKVSIVPATENPGKPIVFTHMMYTGWPDHGVPEDEDNVTLLKFLRLVDSVNKSSNGAVADHDPPIMVNCSAGIGRTGSFIALSSLLRAYGLLGFSALRTPSGPSPAITALHSSSPLGILPKEIADDFVAQEIDNLREQRPGMVQRNEQISLIYQILELAFLDRK
ncbi:protein-tyrosine phosphatase-like protein [Phlebopus sp. FC_14]|nr:protein-tyrosine phosphatase-like protein [Phlebopus sp. FC_14]